MAPKRISKFIFSKIQQILLAKGYKIIKNGYNKKEIFSDSITEMIAIEKYLSIVDDYTMLPNRRLVSLFNLSKYICLNDISGDIVECGVWKGGAIGMMALAYQHFKNTVNVHLFDAFDDIVEPDFRIDGDRAIKEVGGLDNALGRKQPVKDFYKNMGKTGPGTVEDCEELLMGKINYSKSLVKIHKGYFEDTFSKIHNSIEEISILRLDADWYSSTKIALESFYPKVVKGGIVVIDDYGAYEGCRKAVDEYLKKNEIKVLLHYVDNECRYFVKA